MPLFPISVPVLDSTELIKQFFDFAASEMLYLSFSIRRTFVASPDDLATQSGASQTLCRDLVNFRRRKPRKSPRHGSLLTMHLRFLESDERKNENYVLVFFLFMQLFIVMRH